MSQGVPINIPTFEIIKSVLRPSLSTMNAPDMAAIKFHIYAGMSRCMEKCAHICDDEPAAHR